MSFPTAEFDTASVLARNALVFTKILDDSVNSHSLSMFGIRTAFSKSGERPEQKEPSNEVGYDSHPGSPDIRYIPSDRSLLQPETCCCAACSGASEARFAAASRALRRERFPRSGKSPLSSRPHLGLEREPQSGACRHRRFRF